MRRSKRADVKGWASADDHLVPITLRSGRGLSILTIIAGSCLYVYAKSQEAAAPPPAYAPVAMDDLEEGRAAKPEAAAVVGGVPHERRD